MCGMIKETQFQAKSLCKRMYLKTFKEGRGNIHERCLTLYWEVKRDSKLIGRGTASTTQPSEDYLCSTEKIVANMEFSNGWYHNQHQCCWNNLLHGRLVINPSIDGWCKQSSHGIHYDRCDDFHISRGSSNHEKDCISIGRKKIKIKTKGEAIIKME